jgi:tripartite-type tricarboxylate transporter receptor subunit TctC
MHRLIPALLLATSAASALGQAYPTKPIRVVVPYPPGGALDLTARLLQGPLASQLGQPLVIETRTGATGVIGAEFVARSAPDGYTLAYTVVSDLVLRKYVAKNFSLDLLRDFSPVTPLVQSPSCLVVSDASPAGNLRDFLDYVRRNPGRWNFGTPGVGGSQHLTGELLRTHGYDMVHVPFPGLAQAGQGLLSGQVQMAVSNFATLRPLLREGRVKVIAVAQSKRYEGAADVPTVAEAIPGFEMPDSWFGYLAPGGMSAPILARLNSEIRRASRTPEFAAKVHDYDLSVLTMSPEDTAAFIKAADAGFARITSAAKIVPE